MPARPTHFGGGEDTTYTVFSKENMWHMESDGSFDSSRENAPFPGYSDIVRWPKEEAEEMVKLLKIIVPEARFSVVNPMGPISSSEIRNRLLTHFRSLIRRDFFGNMLKKVS